LFDLASKSQLSVKRRTAGPNGDLAGLEKAG